MQKVLVKVVGTQTDDDGEESRIELVSVGTRHEKNGVSYISYRESELTGLEGTTTVLKLYPDHLVLLRMGAVEQKQEFYAGQKRYSTYVTPFGNMKMGIFTRELAIQDGGESATVTVSYDLEINDRWQSFNTLSVNIREEESDECQGVAR